MLNAFTLTSECSFCPRIWSKHFLKDVFPEKSTHSDSASLACSLFFLDSICSILLVDSGNLMVMCLDASQLSPAGKYQKVCGGEGGCFNLGIHVCQHCTTSLTCIIDNFFHQPPLSGCLMISLLTLQSFQSSPKPSLRLFLLLSSHYFPFSFLLTSLLLLSYFSLLISQCFPQQFLSPSFTDLFSLL